MFTKKVVIILFFLYQGLEGSKDNKTDRAYQELFKKTIIGYDCGQIQNITSHKTAQIEACEEDIIHKVRTIWKYRYYKNRIFTLRRFLHAQCEELAVYHIAEHITMDLI